MGSYVSTNQKSVTSRDRCKQGCPTCSDCDKCSGYPDGKDCPAKCQTCYDCMNTYCGNTVRRKERFVTHVNDPFYIQDRHLAPA